MAAILIYLATIAYIPVSLGYISFFFIKKEKFVLKEKININIVIILSIISLSFINKLVGYEKANNYFNIMPETGLMLIMYYISKSANDKFLRFLVILTIIETVITFIQFSLGINTFFQSLYQEFRESDLLYDSRPYGLSSNTSVIALKMFLSIIILTRYNVFENKSIHYLLISILLFGLLITFNRTVIISVLSLFAIYYKNHIFKKKFRTYIFFFLVTLILIVYINHQ
ncbi:hypothetical protein BA6E_101183 [Bacteroidales bacterium 6E]|nr:hypothetical protein BA6E_101183 [Bacteroidales bacterium 6E]